MWPTWITKATSTPYTIVAIILVFIGVLMTKVVISVAWQLVYEKYFGETKQPGINEVSITINKTILLSELISKMISRGQSQKESESGIVTSNRDNKTLSIIHDREIPQKLVIPIALIQVVMNVLVPFIWLFNKFNRGQLPQRGTTSALSGIKPN